MQENRISLRKANKTVPWESSICKVRYFQTMLSKANQITVIDRYIWIQLIILDWITFYKYCGTYNDASGIEIN